MKELAIPANIQKPLARAGLYARKYSPQLLTTTSIVATLAAIVLTAKSAQKHEEMWTVHAEALNLARDAETDIDGESFTKADHARMLINAYREAGLDIVKLYGPTFGAATIAVVAQLASLGIMSKRNAALVASWKVINDTFESYRSRVRKDYGDDVDRAYVTGVEHKRVNVKTEDADGKKSSKKTLVAVTPENAEGFSSPYGAYFSRATAPQTFKNGANENNMFLHSMQDYANDKLRARGHLLLNEVFDMLGLPRTKEGGIVGWAINDDGVGDDYVDFGYVLSVENTTSAGIREANLEPQYLLSFNCQGNVLDLLA